MSETKSIREARAGFASILDRAEAGEATVITRNGAPIAALVPMPDYDALEEAADELPAREVLQHLDEPTATMAEVLADPPATMACAGCASATSAWPTASTTAG